MATTTITQAPARAQPVVDASGMATVAWYTWFTQFVGEVLTGVVTDVHVTSPISSTGTTSGGTSGVITLSLAPSGVTAGTYGDATHVAQVTVAATGIVTNAVNVPITGGGATGQYMPVVVGGLCVTTADDLVAIRWAP